MRLGGLVVSQTSQNIGDSNTMIGLPTAKSLVSAKSSIRKWLRW